MKNFKVKIYYKEKFYSQTHHKSPEKLYELDLSIAAGNEAEAKEKALEEFKFNADNSAVSWEREIERIEIEE